MTRLKRESRETRVEIALDARADDATPPRVTTGIDFLDHMLGTLASYGGMHLVVDARGDLRHHVIEDVGITLGLVLAEEIPQSCVRYGEATVPMDDALVHVALDVGGRAFYRGPVPSSLYDHFLRSLADHAGVTLHVRVLRGTDRHHIVEAAFKALGLSLRRALEPGGSVFSTKGAVRIEAGGD